MRVVWFGHSAFRLEFAGKVVLVDPFFTGNPAFDADSDKAAEGATHILLTHGHGDHVGDTVAIAGRTGAKVVAGFELCMWLGQQGVANLDPMNTGGTTDQDGFTVTMVRADHSAVLIEEDRFVPLGNPNGIIIRAPGEPTVYAMGDTAAFGDMALIQELYEPDLLLVPVGDRFTMGAAEAAWAVKRFFRPKAVIPCHYGSFPIIADNPDAFVAALDGSGVQVILPQKNAGVRIEA